MTLDPSPRQRATLRTRHGKPETLMWCWKGCPHKPPFHSMVNSSLAFAPQSNGAAHHTERLPWKEALHITVLRRATASPAPNTRAARSGGKTNKNPHFSVDSGFAFKKETAKTLFSPLRLFYLYLRLYRAPGTDSVPGWEHHQQPGGAAAGHPAALTQQVLLRERSENG